MSWRDIEPPIQGPEPGFPKRDRAPRSPRSYFWDAASITGLAVLAGVFFATGHGVYYAFLARAGIAMALWHGWRGRTRLKQTRAEGIAAPRSP